MQTEEQILSPIQFQRFVASALELYVANEGDQTYDKKQQGEFNPDDPEAALAALSAYSTTDIDVLQAEISALAQALGALKTQDELGRFVTLYLTPVRVRVLLQATTACLDNINDDSGELHRAGAEALLEQYGTASLYQLQVELGMIEDQCMAAIGRESYPLSLGAVRWMQEQLHFGQTEVVFQALQAMERTITSKLNRSKPETETNAQTL